MYQLKDWPPPEKQFGRQLSIRVIVSGAKYSNRGTC